MLISKCWHAKGSYCKCAAHDIISVFANVIILPLTEDADVAAVLPETMSWLITADTVRQDVNLSWFSVSFISVIGRLINSDSKKLLTLPFLLLPTICFRNSSLDPLAHNPLLKKGNEERKSLCVQLESNRAHFWITGSQSAQSVLVTLANFSITVNMSGLMAGNNNIKSLSEAHRCCEKCPWCGLVKSVRYVHVIMLMSVQLHDCPLWPSVVLPAIDQGRVSRVRSGTSPWWIYQLLEQTRSAFPDDRGDSSLLLRSAVWKCSYQLIARDKVGSVSRHSGALPGGYQTSQWHSEG